MLLTQLLHPDDLALAIVTADIRTYANLLLTIGVRAEGTLR